jgi:hypothetical protein
MLLFKLEDLAHCLVMLMIIAFHREKITCFNSKVFWDMMTFEAQVFIRVLNLCGSTFIISHALSHCHPLPLFVVGMRTMKTKDENINVSINLNTKYKN